MSYTDTTAAPLVYTCSQPLPIAAAHKGATLLVDKPLHWTSFGVIKKLRAIWKVKKIGHAGTLDPLATGLLIVCTGSHTKTIHHYQDMKKVYRGTMVLGKTTPSIDLETDFDSEVAWQHITPNHLQQLIPSFTGTIAQVPPRYAAVKQGGVRAYQKARKGQEFVLAPRQVTIHHLTLDTTALPSIAFEVACSKGTYIRSLVRDMGQQLGVGAYLSSLCRTQIGPFRLEEAYAPSDLAVQ